MAKTVITLEGEGPEFDLVSEKLALAALDSGFLGHVDNFPARRAYTLQLETPLDYLPLSGRVYWRLRDEGIDTVNELISWTARDVRGIRNLGPKALAEIRAVLAQEGLALKDDPGHTVE